ncbi:MAG TPA: zinc ribbon domain-containing protein [Ignavibacteriaceae bacterium]|nr:zinc ribbon domain-containing protein [Ignavibacteriaceae bacterium]
MPVFEYRCEECKTKYEVLHKSSLKQEEVTCPKCHSTKNKKLLSSFKASVSSNSEGSYCENGNCGMPQSSSCGCGSGGCGCN